VGKSTSELTTTLALQAVFIRTFDFTMIFMIKQVVMSMKHDMIAEFLVRLHSVNANKKQVVGGHCGVPSVAGRQ